MVTRNPPGAGPSSEWHALRASLPLIVVGVGLFAGSAVTEVMDPSAGPGGFPLWGLLMTLGFIAAIGATVSWFFANGGPAPTTSSPAEVEVRELGRPAPEVRRAVPEVSAPVWDESVLPASAAPASLPPRKVPVAPAQDEVEKALDEIAEIEAELGIPTPVSPRSAAPHAQS
jgi:hypothetical protein